MSRENIHSHHIFLFPFRWDYRSNKLPLDNASFVARTDLSALKTQLKQILIGKTKSISGTECQWDFFDFSLKSSKDYNEYTYFYPYVRDALYAKKSSEGNKPLTLLQLEYKGAGCLNYEIAIRQFEWAGNIPTRKDDKIILLEIENITLNFYSSGIGIFAFHLSNYQTNSQEDILLINDFGRRLYPQYLGKEILTDSTKMSFLAESITLKTRKGDSFTTPEKFETYNVLSQQNQIFYLPNFIKELVGENFKTDRTDTQVGQIYIEPVIDDRMFVCCWYGNSKLVHTLNVQSCSIYTQSWSYNYVGSDWWYKYLFVDGKDIGASSTKLRHQLSEDHTYYRHAEMGTLIGITRYSFVMLTENIGKGIGEEKFDFVYDVLINHLQTMYFQLVMMALIQRASILRFSHEVTNLSSLEEKNKEDKNKDIKSLHEKYIQFVNKLYFREITAQEQGIELYNVLLEKMDIERNVKDLNQEIDELHQLVDMEQDATQTKMSVNLTKIATIFLPSSVVISLFGMNHFPMLDFKNGVCYLDENVFAPIIISIVATCFVYYFLVYKPENK